MATPIRHFRIEDELWNALGGIGKELDRTQSWLTRKAVEEYIERHRATKRAAKAAAKPAATEPAKDADPRDGF